MTIKIKKCKSIDIDSKLKEYLIKNSDKGSLTDSIKEFFSQLGQNREVMTKMDECKKTPDRIKENIKIITSYINQLNLLRKKMTFGKEKYSCKIEFNWTDTIKNSTSKSVFIEFEICNSMFNLATYYFYDGFNLSNNPQATKEIHKDATNNFKNAMYIYNWIKEEIKKIPEKEIPLDLHESYLDYCITLCQISGQMEIYKIAKETSPKEFLLHSKLINETSSLYRKLANLYSSMNLKKSVSEYLVYYQNRSIYYKAQMYLELKNDGKKQFDEKGTGYGYVVYFYNLALTEFTECQKTIKKLSKIMKIEEFEAEYKKVSEEKKEADDLNNRIYHEALPREGDIKIESKNMMSMALPEELYIEENESKAKTDERIYCADLDLLAPKEIKDMIGRYKPQINDLISSNLDKYENEGTISNFIQELNIPKKLKKNGKEDIDDKDDSRELPKELWEKIEKVQQIGGANGLNKIMQGIMGKSNFLINSLENLLHSFEAEDKDDRIHRQRFRDKWIREPSLKLNYQMVQAAQGYIKSIQQTKIYDQQASNEINGISYHFDQLMLPLFQLNKNIPVTKKPIKELTEEEKEVKKEIEKLYELSDKCTEIIKPIFSQLNDDSVLVGLFMDVLNKKATEQAIYEKNKGEFEHKFEELNKLSEEVKKQEEVINELVKKHSEKIIPKVDENEENKIIEYYRHLDELTNMFMAKYEKIQKGDNYYNELKEKVDKLIKFGNDWMIKRSDEKNALIKSFGNLYSSQMYDGGAGYRGPGS